MLVQEISAVIDRLAKDKGASELISLDCDSLLRHWYMLPSFVSIYERYKATNYECVKKKNNCGSEQVITF